MADGPGSARPLAFRNPIVTRQIGVRAYVTEPGQFKQIPQASGLLPAMFQDQPAARHEVGWCARDDRAHSGDTREDQRSVRECTEGDDRADVLPAQPLTQDERVLRSDRDDQREPQAETGECGVEGGGTQPANRMGPPTRTQGVGS